MPKSLRATTSGGIDFESFLSSNATTGEIRTKHDARVLILTADTFLALADAVRERLGDEVGDVLYRAGRTWGHRRFAEFAAEAEHDGEVLYHMRNMGIDQFKQHFNDLLVCGGWGTFSIEERFDTALVHVNNSAVHDMVAGAHQHYAEFFAGFLAGFFTELIGVELDAVQVGGLANADEPCTFLLADESIIAPVRAWLDSGKSREEIFELLQAKDYENQPPPKQPT